MKVVIKITGKVFEPGNENLLGAIGDITKKLVNLGHRIAIVTGGGATARKYIDMARKLGVSEAWCDVLGLEASRLNARLIISILGDLAYNDVPRSVDEFLRAWSTGKVVVLGGLQPGQSTTTVASIIAELICADLLILATDVDGIYDKDPKKFSNARKYNKITIAELRNVLLSGTRAGTYELLDSLSMSVIERSRIRTHVVSIFNPENIIRIVMGAKGIGTEIVFD